MNSTERPTGAAQTSVGPVGIFWDMENCRIPSDISPDDVAVNIRMALRLHPLTSGAVISFSAYGDFNGFPRRLRQACQCTGVKLVDVPRTRKDAVDKAILVDLFLFALDHSPPTSILLISGNMDFAQTLHVLSQRGYTIVLAAPVRVPVSPALRNAGHFFWDWPGVARGSATGGAAADSSTKAVEDEIPFIQPGDLEGLKKQVVRLLKETRGSLPMLKLPEEYRKMFGREFFLAEYGTGKLVKLLDKIGDVVAVIGEGESRVVVLQREGGGGSSSDGAAINNSTLAVDEVLFILPPDFEGLKKQVMKLLKEVGGSLSLLKLPEVYAKMFGQTLCLADHGPEKLIKLLDCIGDGVTVIEEGETKVVVLRREEEGSSAGAIAIDHSTQPVKEDIPFVLPRDIEGLKKQVVSLLKEAGGSLPLLKFPEEYEKLYGQVSYLADCRADTLVKLLDSIKDVVTIVEEGESKVLLLRREVEEGSSFSCDAAIDRPTPVVKHKNPYVLLGNVEGLKKQVAGLLKGAGGKLPLVKLSSEYTKMYGQALFSVENGDEKLAKLLGSIGDVVTVVEEENNDVVVLQQEEENESSSSDKRKRRRSDQDCMHDLI